MCVNKKCKSPMAVSGGIETGSAVESKKDKDSNKGTKGTALARVEYEEMMADLYYDTEIAIARKNRAERILNAHLASGQQARQRRAGGQIRQKKRASWGI